MLVVLHRVQAITEANSNMFRVNLIGDFLSSFSFPHVRRLHLPHQDPTLGANIRGVPSIILKLTHWVRTGLRHM